MERWPDAYPESLKKISWRIETKYDEVICGPLPYWTKMLPASLKASTLFVKQVLTDYFWNNGCIQMLSDPVCRYFVKCFTVAKTKLLFTSVRRKTRRRRRTSSRRLLGTSLGFGATRKKERSISRTSARQSSANTTL